MHRPGYSYFGTLAAAALVLIGTTAARAASPQDDRLAAAVKAIEAFDKAFAEAFNKGDAKALAAMFTEDAEAVEADGAVSEGRAAIEEGFAATFAELKGVQIAFEAASIRLLAPGVAKEEGKTILKAPGGETLSRLSTVIYVEKDGAWKIASAKEAYDETATPYDHLKVLGFLVGDWVDESEETEVRVHCEWAKNKNYLFRTFLVKRDGKVVIDIQQRIGWDPASKQIRSWDFDSEGGFGEGRWSRDGDRWLIKHTGTHANGVVGTSTNVMTVERADLIHWVATDRTLSEDALTDPIGYTLAKVPPPPGNKPAAPAAPQTKPEGSVQ